MECKCICRYRDFRNCRNRIGFTIDFTNGIKFGVGWGLGYEISLNIDWYELFN